MTDMLKTSALVTLVMFSINICAAREQLYPDGTYLYSCIEDEELYIDIYYAKYNHAQAPTILFIPSGGFCECVKDAPEYILLFDKATNMGINVISIEYTAKEDAPAKIKATKSSEIRQALQKAIDDLRNCLEFVVDNCMELEIDPSTIFAVGIEAGAMTALTYDYLRCNDRQCDQYPGLAGIISISGAGLYEQGIRYRYATPSPALFIHGTEDKRIPLKKKSFLKTCIAGPKAIEASYGKTGAACRIHLLENAGHEICCNPLEHFAQIEKFIRESLP